MLRLRRNSISPSRMHWVEDRLMIYSNLCGSSKSILDVLQTSTSTPILTWAPQDQGQLLKVATAVREGNARGAFSQMMLAIPFDAFPGCKRAEDITDIWTHPLLTKKWADTVVRIQLLAPPSHMIFTDPVAPIHVILWLAAVEALANEVDVVIQKQMFSTNMWET